MSTFGTSAETKVWMNRLRRPLKGSSRTDWLCFVFPSSVSKAPWKIPEAQSRSEPRRSVFCHRRSWRPSQLETWHVYNAAAPPRQKSIHRSVYGKCKISEPIEVVFFFFLLPKNNGKKKTKNPRPISRFLLVGSFWDEPLGACAAWRAAASDRCLWGSCSSGQSDGYNKCNGSHMAQGCGWM